MSTIIRFSDALNRESLRPVKSPAAVSLTSITTVNVLNVSGERGVLQSIAFRIATAITGSPVITLRIQIDGGTVMDILLYNGSTAMDKDASGYISHAGATGSSTSALNLAWTMVLELPYNNAALVAVIIGTAASAGDLDFETVRKIPV